MSKRLTVKEIKHDIREDEVRTFLGSVFQKIVDKPILVLAIVGAIFGLALVIAGTLAILDSRRQAAAAELAAAIETYGAAVGDEAAESGAEAPSFATEEERLERSKEAFEEIHGSVGAGASAEVAGLYLADIALAEGDAETARKVWQEFLAANADHVLALSVRLNLIRLDRDSGRAAEVAAELEKELADPAKTLPEDILLFELAQTRDALGESETAVELYQRILDEYPLSPYAAEARRMATAAGP